VQQSACQFVLYERKDVDTAENSNCVSLKAGPTCKLSVTFRLHKHDNGMLTVSRIKKDIPNINASVIEKVETNALFLIPFGPSLKI
jgi:hypothetical protein